MAATANRRNYNNITPVRGTAAPKVRPRPAPRQQPNLKVVRKTNKQLDQETKRARARAIKIIAVAALLFAIFSFQIYGKLKMDELDQQIADINQQISVVESDNSRRNMELSANVSLERVDEYARNELGMVKISDYQVNYVKLAGEDEVEVSGGKTHQNIAQKVKIQKNE